MDDFVDFVFSDNVVDLACATLECRMSVRFEIMASASLKKSATGGIVAGSRMFPFFLPTWIRMPDSCRILAELAGQGFPYDESF